MKGREGTIKEICEVSLLDMAEEGLRSLGIDSDEIAHWLGIVRARLESGQTGAAWQRAWVAQYGKQFKEMTEHYLEWQQTGRPVHQWRI